MEEVILVEWVLTAESGSLTFTGGACIVVPLSDNAE